MKPLILEENSQISVDHPDGTKSVFSTRHDGGIITLYCNDTELGYISRSSAAPGMMVLRANGEILHTDHVDKATAFLIFGER